MPDLYVCGFTRVAYVLSHAEIRAQGSSPRFLTDDTNGTSASPM